ncbi:three-Cys-motif partner protein TcmP [Streptosporangium lutulentum]|uniref:three-Cys-motif partner protein TcmP n=1 Tax=Streptosporangium lutulentum TaxID=1461250 RepID=UPI0027D7D0E5|nr:three-Cys-motif partner protein TcmP [Streptosporangium lutulentum]
MPTPQPLLWSCAPHTRAKHELLRRYLEAWFPILLQGPRARECVTYVEGFAGPGIYKTGEPGSPIVALQVFLRQRRLLDTGKRTNVVLIEERADRLERLKKEVNDATTQYGNVPEGMRIEFRNDRCADTLLSALDAVKAMNTPIFAFLDSWGGPDIPLDVARAIAGVPSSEVLVTFGTRFLMQFGKAETHQAAGDQAFGGPSWRKVWDLPSDKKKSFLVSTYRESLKAAGFRYVLSFEMLGEGGHDLHLVYGTTNALGLEKMKEAMWKVDPIRGVNYRDPRDPDQLSLEFSFNPDTGPLRRAILEELTKGERTLAQLREFALLETVYRPPQATTVVRDLLGRGLVERDPVRGQLSADKVIRLVPKASPEMDPLF